MTKYNYNMKLHASKLKIKEFREKYTLRPKSVSIIK
jgi:hypothetical protein